MTVKESIEKSIGEHKAAFENALKQVAPPEFWYELTPELSGKLEQAAMFLFYRGMEHGATAMVNGLLAGGKHEASKT